MTSMVRDEGGGWRASLTTMGMILATLWIIPGIVHRAMHYCPVRPDGVNQAGAVPAFSRRLGIGCSQCHTAFPALNDFGRQFKLNGYVREKGEPNGLIGTMETKDGSSLQILQTLPLGAMAIATPYDKGQSDREFRLTAINAFKVFLAGGDLGGRDVSIWGELEAAPPDAAQGETTAVKNPEFQIGYHPSSYMNLLVGSRSFFAMDPYQTLTNMGSPTVADRSLVVQGQTSLDTLDNQDEVKQTATLYGRADKEGWGGLYYSAGASAGRGDPYGQGPKNGAVRLAFDTFKGFMLGGFGSFGHTGGGVPPVLAGVNPGDKFRFSRMGVDTLVELAGFTGRSVFMYSNDKDLSLQARAENNRAAYAELFYVLKRNDRPFLVPLVRQNWFQTNDGRREFASFDAQLAHYFRENVKGFIEYAADTRQDGPPGTPRPAKDHRWTAQVEVGF